MPNRVQRHSELHRKEVLWSCSLTDCLGGHCSQSTKPLPAPRDMRRPLCCFVVKLPAQTCIRRPLRLGAGVRMVVSGQVWCGITSRIGISLYTVSEGPGMIRGDGWRSRGIHKVVSNPRDHSSSALASISAHLALSSANPTIVGLLQREPLKTTEKRAERAPI